MVLPAGFLKDRLPVTVLIIWVYAAFKEEAERTHIRAARDQNIASLVVPDMDICTSTD
jgi:hypothetical protein